MQLACWPARNSSHSASAMRLLTHTFKDACVALAELTHADHFAGFSKCILQLCLFCSTVAQCTGTLIGARCQHVLTAGHCLHDSSTGGLASDKISFYPSINGNIMPFAAINALTVRHVVR